MLRIKRNDTVLILTGKDRGKRGTVLEVITEKDLVKVSGIHMLTKHYKARRQGEVSAIKRQEGYINISNVMLINPADSKPTRVRFKTDKSGTKSRVSHRTEQVI